jgi:hypothetical protein
VNDPRKRVGAGMAGAYRVGSVPAGAVRAAVALGLAMLLASPVRAGLIDALDEDARALQLCIDRGAPAEASGDYAHALEVWRGCAEEARAQGWTGSQRRLEDQAEFARALVAAGPYRESDPGRFQLAVLERAAMQKARTWLTPTVNDVFRAWVATEAGKQRMSRVRTITVHWEGGMRVERRKRDPAMAERVRASELIRRYLEDLGLRWAEPGSPEVDVILHARLARKDLAPRISSRMGNIPRAEASVSVSMVRMPKLDLTEEGFDAKVAAEDADATVARDDALRAACSDIAARTLKVVLRAGIEH